MKDEKAFIGTIVESTAGRDAGRVMVVTGITEDGLVLVCDGRLRKISSPKKKKRKHLKVIATADEESRQRLLYGQVTDSFLRRILGSMAIDDDLI